MSEICLRFDEDLLPHLGESPEELERHALGMIALGNSRRHAITAGRAAELLGMERFAFICWTGALGIPYVDLSADELREESRAPGSR